MSLENYTSLLIPRDLHHKFKINCVLEGITIQQATEQACYNWIDKIETRRYASISSGTGTLGRAARSPEKFKAALNDLRNQDPIDEDAIILKS